MDKNPWEKLTRDNFVLDTDKFVIEEFNRTVLNPDYRIFLDQPPVPFVGNPAAQVVFLNLNPGYQKEDTELYRRKEFLDRALDNLAHRNREFYFLDESCRDNSGYRWWTQKMKLPIKEVGLQKVIKNLFVIEYFPYHSKRFRPMNELLASQYYGLELVRKAIERKALIVAMRSRKRWLESIPELNGYSLLCTLKNPQCAVVSRNNFNGNFDELIKNLHQ